MLRRRYPGEGRLRPRRLPDRGARRCGRDGRRSRWRSVGPSTRRFPVAEAARRAHDSTRMVVDAAARACEAGVRRRRCAAPRSCSCTGACRTVTTSAAHSTTLTARYRVWRPDRRGHGCHRRRRRSDHLRQHGRRHHRVPRDGGRRAGAASSGYSDGAMVGTARRVAASRPRAQARAHGSVRESRRRSRLVRPIRARCDRGRRFSESLRQEYGRAVARRSRALRRRGREDRCTSGGPSRISRSPNSSALAVPTLVLQGDDDIVTLEHGVAMARAIPDAQLAVVPGTTTPCCRRSRNSSAQHPRRLPRRRTGHQVVHSRGAWRRALSSARWARYSAIAARCSTIGSG